MGDEPASVVKCSKNAVAALALRENPQRCSMQKVTLGDLGHQLTREALRSIMVDLDPRLGELLILARVREATSERHQRRLPGPEAQCKPSAGSIEASLLSRGIFEAVGAR